MRRYLTFSEAQAALNRGKQIEQFLGAFLSGDEPAIRYAVVRPDRERIVATVYECLEPEQQTDFCDVGEFRAVEPDTDPKDHYFDSLEDALAFLKYQNGASEERYVNQGLVDEEYREFKKDKKDRSK